jgi:hypothetical protein
LAVILTTGTEFVDSAWPPAFGGQGWRFGAIRFLAGSLMTPMLALAIALGAAVGSGHRWIQYLIFLAFSFFTLLLISIPTFILDSIQIGSRLQPDAAGSFEASRLKAATKLLLGLVVFLLFSTTAFKGARRLGRERPKKGSKEDRRAHLVWVEGGKEGE